MMKELEELIERHELEAEAAMLRRFGWAMYSPDSQAWFEEERAKVLGAKPEAASVEDVEAALERLRPVTCLEIVMHPEDYAQLAESVGEASGGAGVRGVMVRSNPNMTKGTIGQRMSDGSWRFTSVGETTREGER